MKIKIDIGRLANTSCNTLAALVVTEIVGETIKAIKKKVKNVKREGKEAQ